MCSEATVKYKHGVSSGYVMKQYYCESVLFACTFILNCLGVYCDMLLTFNKSAFGIV